MERILIMLALLAAVIGFFSLSEAALGAGIIGLACLLGIFARLAQAANHQLELRQALAEMEQTAQRLRQN